MAATSLVQANGPSAPEWAERGTIADGGLVLSFEGVNQDEQDRLDEHNFVRGLHAPAKDDPNYDAIVNVSEDGTHRTSHDAKRWMTGCALAALTMLLTPAFLGPLVLLAAPLAGVVGYFLPSLIRSARELRAAPIRRGVRGAFECTITSTQFVCSGFLCHQAFELGSIASFVGDIRLWVRLNDGRMVRLPARLESRDHAPLAARLNELLLEATAIFQGYRG